MAASKKQKTSTTNRGSEPTKKEKKKLKPPQNNTTTSSSSNKVKEKEIKVITQESIEISTQQNKYNLKDFFLYVFFVSSIVNQKPTVFLFSFLSIPSKLLKGNLCQSHKVMLFYQVLIPHSKHFWVHVFVQQFGQSLVIVMKRLIIGNHYITLSMGKDYKHGNIVLSLLYVRIRT